MPDAPIVSPPPRLALRELLQFHFPTPDSGGYGFLLRVVVLSWAFPSRAGASSLAVRFA